MKSVPASITGKWLLLSLCAGIAAGLGAIVFDVLGQLVSHYVLGASGFAPAGAKGEFHWFEHEFRGLSFAVLLTVLVAGGMVSGWIVYTFAPEAEGHGTDGAIDAFHDKRGIISIRVAIVKTLASAVTLGTGGSGGREGPIAQIGAALGSFMGQRFGLSARDRRILMAAGMGAGVGAIFRAPLAGAIFAGEIMYREADLESDVVVPTAISSIVAYSIFGLFLPEELMFAHVFGELPEFAMSSLLELLPYGLMAIVLAAVGRLYITAFYGVQTLFERMPGRPHFKPAIGAALAGCVAMGLYYSGGEESSLLAVLSTGYGALQTGLELHADDAGALTIRVLLLIAMVKILTTSLTISSGGSGGVFGPSMVIGGCLGVATGRLVQDLMPDVDPRAFGVVGMAGFFAGIARAPISTIIMVSEMTGSYHLLLPTMWVSTLCFLLCNGTTLCRCQVPTRLESPAHRGDFTVDVLEGIKVRDTFQADRSVEIVPEAMPLSAIVQMLTRTHQHYFPVVNDAGEMVGIFSSDDVRSFIYDQSIWQLADAADVMTTEFLSVAPDDDLNEAMRKFTSLNLDELPILDPEQSGRLLGMLRRKESIAAYNRELASRQEAAQHEAK